jgi:pimeloyl-ACP methyl ester carboxylesterase
VRNQLLRLGLAVLAISAFIPGLWAALAPRSFYDDFPGFGRSWVAPDGPYNEHLVRDVGDLYLALGIVTAVAAVALGQSLVRGVLVAWFVSGLLHVVYHSRHSDVLETGDAVASLISLALGPILPLLLFALTYPPTGDTRPTPVGTKSAG